jgi:hypothetical protein
MSFYGGAWRSLAARQLWELKVVGSNPTAPTISDFSANSPEFATDSETPPEEQGPVCPPIWMTIS